MFLVTPSMLCNQYPKVCGTTFAETSSGDYFDCGIISSGGGDGLHDQADRRAVGGGRDAPAHGAAVGESHGLSLCFAE